MAIDPNDPRSVAQWFVEQMRKPRDLDAEAEEAAFEADKAALLHVWHVRRGNKPATARTREEMEYAASLDPCPKCGRRELGATSLSGAGTTWTISSQCPSCGTERRFTFKTEGDPTAAAAHAPDELSRLPSFLITQEAFFGELQRLLPLLRTDAAARSRALVTINELVKLTDPHLRDQRRTELQALVTRSDG
jgi:hypothetical protein